ncbi:MAG: hypothetical protein ABJG41_00315 [Cyclobacteriaceae bacterium]
MKQVFLFLQILLLIVIVSCSDDKSSCFGKGPNASSPPSFFFSLRYVDSDTGKNLVDEYLNSLTPSDYFNISVVWFVEGGFVDSLDFWAVNPLSPDSKESPDNIISIGGARPSFLTHEFIVDIPEYVHDTFYVKLAEPDKIIQLLRSDSILYQTPFCDYWDDTLITLSN